ncbi:DNA/RNA nuclease SfsA [Bacteriovorax stolpii]|uniref:Sugar fermentation stimulation protein homolog n=1 Tax=Bacteriovorax stolpii TaxID=960 RepID=A0A2K9NTY0_BACTC|nr:DNA/RNA nuclease SfsA [Bacteriovorax stolpii]AUN98979.1 DNA/RNA nuclease SfsA [Bacteriovorax stolpii]TDP55498.1 sugar fermentation stimulation protein [Bacteriovorax stolpii]
MKFKTPLHSGIFQKRYKRFFADIKMGEEIVVAHTANTGTMKTCLGEGWQAMMSYHDSPTRKLKYSFEMINNGKTWIGINTSLTNGLAIEAIQNGVIKELQGYKDLKPEAKIGQSRIDILLSNSPDEQCYVEVKNVTLIDDHGHALFPDAVTERGLKHLGELLELKKQGVRTVMLFVVQREDCHSFKVEQDIDPAYCKKLKEVINEGVEVLVYQCKLSPEEIIVHKKLSIV